MTDDVFDLPTVLANVLAAFRSTKVQCCRAQRRAVDLMPTIQTHHDDGSVHVALCQGPREFWRPAILHQREHFGPVRVVAVACDAYMAAPRPVPEDRTELEQLMETTRGLPRAEVAAGTPDAGEALDVVAFDVADGRTAQAYVPYHVEARGRVRWDAQPVVSLDGSALGGVPDLLRELAPRLR